MHQSKPLTEAIKLDLRLDRTSPPASDFSLDVNVEIAADGVTAIFGNSGCGKTTLLRCIAGLERDCEGTIVVNGAVWQDHSRFMPPHKRPVGYVFQEASLFPHLTARQNLQYAAKRSGGRTSEQSIARVAKAMDIVHILDRHPKQLSGGERQRAAIARALLIEPQLLLMDEPLASLDEQRKHEILPFLERLKSDFNLPILYVSHSMAEVARLADRAIIVDAGTVVAQGSLKDVFSRIDRSALTTKSTSVVLLGHIVERDSRWQLAKVRCSGGDLWISDSNDSLNTAVRINVLARDVSLTRSTSEDSSILNRIHVEVTEIVIDEALPVALVRLKFGDDYLIARVTRKSCYQLNLAVGDRLWAQIKSVAVLR